MNNIDKLLLELLLESRYAQISTDAVSSELV